MDHKSSDFSAIENRTNTKEWKFYLSLALLVTTAFVSFAGLVSSQFLYDDLLVIAGNAEVQRILNWRDCFLFVLKPTRPISDFFLALGQFLGKGNPGPQKLLSVLLHCANVLMLFLNVDFLLRKSQTRFPRGMAAAIVFLFAVHPIHTETIAIGQYRMEMLASFFTLVAIFSTQLAGEYRSRPILSWLSHFFLFISLGMALLSKETYFVVAFLLILLVHTQCGLSLAFLKRLCLMQMFWGLVLLIQLEKDTSTSLPYSDLIGYGVITPAKHFNLAARSLVENLIQIFAGRGMTITRLSDRNGTLAGIALVPSVLLILASLTSWLMACKKGGWWRLWTSWIVISAGIYLVIPNINIGSEHYWYLGTAGIYGITLGLLWMAVKKFTLNMPTLSVSVFWGFVAVLGTSYFLSTQSRISEMQTREKFYSAELKRHPESVSTWIDLAATYLQIPNKESAEKAKPLLDHARLMDPHHLTLLNNDFLYSVITQNNPLTEKIFGKLRELYLAKPKHLAGYYLFAAKTQMENRDCTSARKSMESFKQLKPDGNEHQSLSDDFAKLCQSNESS